VLVKCTVPGIAGHRVVERIFRRHREIKRGPYPRRPWGSTAKLDALAGLTTMPVCEPVIVGDGGVRGRQRLRAAVFSVAEKVCTPLSQP